MSTLYRSKTWLALFAASALAMTACGGDSSNSGGSGGSKKKKDAAADEDAGDAGEGGGGAGGDGGMGGTGGGGTGGGGAGGKDGGAGMGGGGMGGTGGAKDGGAGMVMPDGPIEPPGIGRKLDGTGLGWYSIGVAEDGSWVAAAKGTTPGMIEVKVYPTAAGAAAVTIASDVFAVGVANNVLLVAHANGPTPMGGLPGFRGKVSYWKTGLTGPKEIGSNVLIFGAGTNGDVFFVPAAVSPDGNWIALVDNFTRITMPTTTTPTADVKLVDVKANTMPVTVHAGVYADSAGALDPQLGFTGDNGFLVMGFAKNNAATAQTLEGYAVTAPTTNVFATGASAPQSRFFLPAPKSNEVAIVHNVNTGMGIGDISIIKVAATGNTPNKIVSGASVLRSQGDAPNCVPTISANGKYVSYFTAFDHNTTHLGTLNVIPTAMGSMSALIATGTANFDQFSPDGTTVLYNKKFLEAKNGGSLYERKSDASTQEKELASGATMATEGTTYGIDAFSADSKYFVFYTDLTDEFTGTLHFVPVGGTAELMNPGPTVWAHAFLPNTNKVVYNPNSKWIVGAGATDGRGYGDVHVRDLSSNMDREIQKHADIQSSDSSGFKVGGNFVIFTLDQGDPMTDGIYVFDTTM